ncbi:TetR/AcrR family transcriptional regulator [Bacillus rubiinfantis]|uniref:TetR/AcrR family transcriptional regulator n=1 Tax=Bacillus rubiinfantis TaxID=1499680 RepID=UPI0005AAB2E5|nr:TetR/AcrR family transcriptional regulator [Bacillus rubiinfantis]
MTEKENSKDKLIKTASRLFQLQGYHATGLNQITKESGAPKGSLYYHFPGGKEQLALEAVQLTAKFVSDQIKCGLDSSPDPVKAIQGFVEDIAAQFQKYGGKGGVPIASIALETALISEPLRKACQTAYKNFQDAFTQKLLTAGYETNHAKELGIVINTMVEGAFLLSFTMGNSEPLRLVAKQIPVLLQ